MVSSPEKNLKSVTLGWGFVIRFAEEGRRPSCARVGGLAVRWGGGEQRRDGLEGAAAMASGIGRE